MAQTPCTYRQGGATLDYTPGSAVTAGDVVLLGTKVCIAPLDIAASTKGSIATEGVWNVPTTTTAIALGDRLYWDADGNPYGGTAGSGAFSNDPDVGYFAGWAVEAKLGSVGDVDMMLNEGNGAAGTLADLFAGNDTVVVGGTALANANAVSYGFNLVTGADNTAAVRLPAAAAGRVVIIKSGTASNILKVFPTANDKINNAAANAVYNQAALALRTYYANDDTNWWTDEETPT